MGFNVIFYQTKSRINDLNKVLTQLGDPITCDVTGEIAPDNLNLLIDFDDFNVLSNYAYIETFKRFYFVKYKIIGNLVQCELTSDPLISFKDDVLNADVIALRSSNLYNRYMVDKVAVNTKKIKTYVSRFAFEFDTSNSGNHYILTVGGK